MLTLRPAKLEKISIPVATGWLLGECMEARGKQDLWLKQKPEVLAVLRELAIIQSVESSNRIEGVTISTDRLRPLLLGKSRPRDRSEEELAGYKQALDWIFSKRPIIEPSPSLFLKLHEFAQGGFSGDAGSFKKRDNEILEVMPNGERQIRFTPTTARETPAEMERLCDAYNRFVQESAFPPLLACATLIFDFLCIHPFRDGNGRVSRLMTTLLLEAQGFRVSRYVSLERLVEQSKEEYYSVLKQCSAGWHEGKNDIVPWWNYFLTIMRRGYQDLERQVDSVEARPAKSELVRATILEQQGDFTLSELKSQLPSTSLQLIKKMLSDLKSEGKVRLEGRGRGARWNLARKRRIG